MTSTPTPGRPDAGDVRAMFDRIAPTYDRLNHLLSLGVDRLWRRRTVRAVKQQQRPAPRILDVATGTADLAIALARRIPGARITGIDLSSNMVAVGREKVAAVERAGKIPARAVALQTGDALSLPFADEAFDAVTAAFGVRNFPDIPAGISEMYRVLAPGGSVFVLEFSAPRGKIFAPVFRWYFHRVLPWVGRRISRDGGAYRYLPESVDTFPAPDAFRKMLSEVGFCNPRSRALTFGIAYLHTAIKE